MKTIIITILILFTGITLNAQTNINSVLTSIEENNTTLKSLRESADAQKLENRTGIYLDNPEVGFNYVWGNPTDIGNRTDLSVSQTFDIPTITGMKGRLANGRNDLVEWQYKSDRMNILLEAKQYCTELIYYNALKKELDLRLQHAQTIASGYKERMDRGDANILEYNKSRLNLLNITKDLETNDLERKSLLTKLEGLNGGITINFSSTEWPSELLPTNFEEWYAQAATKNPLLTWLATEINLAQKEIKLNYANAAPKFSAGYTMEQVVGQKYQGITVGMSIPLWQDAKKIKYAKAKNIAAENTLKDKQLQFKKLAYKINCTANKLYRL